MADVAAKREARRRRILENSEYRLQRIIGQANHIEPQVERCKKGIGTEVKLATSSCAANGILASEALVGHRSVDSLITELNADINIDETDSPYAAEHDVFTLLSTPNVPHGRTTGRADVSSENGNTPEPRSVKLDTSDNIGFNAERRDALPRSRLNNKDRDDPISNTNPEPSMLNNLLSSRLIYALLAIVVNIMVVLRMTHLFGTSIVIPFFVVMIGRLCVGIKHEESRGSDMLWCDDLEELLQCPICMIRPTSWIFQCIQGHHICKNCKIQLILCPTCDQRFSSSRNRLAEHLCSKLDDIKLSLIDPESEIIKLLTPDTVSSASQTDETPASEVIEKIHERPQGPYPCRVGACTTSRYFEPLMKHLATAHPDNFLQLRQDGNVFQHTWTIEYTEEMTFDRAVLIIDIGTFFLKLSTDVFGNLTGFVSMVENCTLSRQYFYQLEVTCCAEHKYPSYNGEVLSCRSSVGPLPEKCLQIKRAELQRPMDHEKELECTLLLAKKRQTEEFKQPQQTWKKKYSKKRNNSEKPSGANGQSESRPGPSNAHSPVNVRQARSVSRSNGIVNRRSPGTSSQ